MQEAPHALRAWAALNGLQLRQLAAGAFHCCCVTVTGELWTWGHPWGKDHANGNLLAQGNEMTMDQDATPDVDNPQMGPTHINGLEVQCNDPVERARRERVKLDNLLPGAPTGRPECDELNVQRAVELGRRLAFRA